MSSSAFGPRKRLGRMRRAAKLGIIIPLEDARHAGKGESRAEEH
ncbi:MAG: hypothetical protein ACP5KE_05705 [Candidatus Methanodesulfokora sp.]